MCTIYTLCFTLMFEPSYIKCKNFRWELISVMREHRNSFPPNVYSTVIFGYYEKAISSLFVQKFTFFNPKSARAHFLIDQSADLFT